MKKWDKYTPKEIEDLLRKIHELEQTIKDQSEVIERMKWISVEDRLPNQATFIIAHKENGLVLGLYFNADKEFMYGKVDQTRQITHWMPLPLTPTKDK